MTEAINLPQESRVYLRQFPWHEDIDEHGRKELATDVCSTEKRELLTKIVKHTCMRVLSFLTRDIVGEMERRECVVMAAPGQVNIV